MTQLSWTYNTLTAAIQSWLDDFDTDITPAILANILYLGEIRVIEDLDLTVFSEQSTATYNTFATPVLANANVARPAAVLVTDAMGYQTAASAKFVPMERRDASFVLDYLDPAVKGPPKYYAESDTVNWLVAPYADQTYTLVAYGPNAAASLVDTVGGGGNTTTWISTNAAEVLWESCLVQAAIFLKNVARQQEHMQSYNTFVMALRRRFRSLRRNTPSTSVEQNVEKPAGQTPASKEG